MTDEERRFRIKELKKKENINMALAGAALAAGVVGIVAAVNGSLPNDTATLAAEVLSVNGIALTPFFINNMSHAISEKTVLEVQMDEKEGRSR